MGRPGRPPGRLPRQKLLFPSATPFGPKEGKPAIFKAYAADPKTRAQSLLGYAAYTTDWQPFERGYDGPIKILVGVSTAGFVTNVVVGNLWLDHVLA